MARDGHKPVTFRLQSPTLSLYTTHVDILTRVVHQLLCELLFMYVDIVAAYIHIPPSAHSTHLHDTTLG